MNPSGCQEAAGKPSSGSHRKPHKTFRDSGVAGILLSRVIVETCWSVTGGRSPLFVVAYSQENGCRGSVKDALSSVRRYWLRPWLHPRRKPVIFVRLDAMTLVLQVAGKTDVGVVRTNNEDNLG